MTLYNIIIVLLLIWMYFRYIGPILVTFKLDSPYARRPTRAYGKAACWDVYSIEAIDAIPAGQWREVQLGISFAPWPHIYIPFLNLTLTPFGNVAIKMHTRSGLAIRKGARNHLGIIDNDYRESLSAIIYNHGAYPFRIKRGQKVAQIEVYRVPNAIFIRKNKLSKSNRGRKGLGSSGE